MENSKEVTNTPWDEPSEAEQASKGQFTMDAICSIGGSCHLARLT
jgi:hypothetical protein